MKLMARRWMYHTVQDGQVRSCQTEMWYRCIVPPTVLSGKSWCVGGMSLHRHVCRWSCVLFWCCSIPPATILFRQEVKLRETSLCLYELAMWTRKVWASFKALSCILSVISSSLSGCVHEYNSSCYLLKRIEPTPFWQKLVIIKLQRN
jgi:hypothetical protein